MGARITTDGLWRCLCPSFDAIAYTRALNALNALPEAQASRILASRCSVRSLQDQKRRFRDAANRRQQVWNSQHDGIVRKVGAGRNAVDYLVKTTSSYKRLYKFSTPDIYDALQELSRTPGKHQDMAEFVRFLVQDRGEPPSTALYEYLLQAHSHPSGSMATVAELLKEMRTTQVPFSTKAYLHVLRALAVHPNYVERNNILREMRERWLEIPPAGHQAIAIGLLRDGQYELALEKLDEMVVQNIPIQTWVFDIFVYVLGQLGAVEEALRIVHYRLQAHPKGISLNVWYFLLDFCSRHLYLDGTKYVWNRMVQSRLINPSDGMALNALNTATRHSDARLATQIIQYLTSRGTKLGMHHFEALIECYALANDVHNALQTLCIMAKAGIRPDCGSTRAIYQSLKTTGSIDEAVKSLCDLRGDNNVPLAAFNVVLEAALYRDDFNKALELYRQVHEICHSGPSLITFKHLLNRCDDPDIAQFLISEMEEFKVKRDCEADVRLIRIFTVHGELAKALRHFCDLTTAGRVHEISSDNADWLAKRDAALSLLERCIDETGLDSEETRRIIAACQAGCLDLSSEIRSLMEGESNGDSFSSITSTENESRELVSHG